ncbi:hypothetical protein [Nocardia cyriacigeorgica]|uniref:DUF5709 domain-containing protein n=1 Tax=Nocardia cyriacigeorgica TaxID=135487 RepID=A0A5R8NGJ7_9NOCA|nr:hypothetical protein [Nocardia cyriacigeorgica]TLF74822.1 hypothetical protein FEK34_22755 [Nocardia cyriacigeorgica]
MDRDPLDEDMGDDEQADEIRAYEDVIEDPPADLHIRNRPGDDDGRLGIEEELDQQWTPRRRAAELADDDDRPAELAAMEIVEEPDE